MAATAVLVLHDDGKWYEAQLLSQEHRDRATATGAAASGTRWMSGCSSIERCRPACAGGYPLKMKSSGAPNAEARDQEADDHHGRAPVQTWGRHELRR